MLDSAPRIAFVLHHLLGFKIRDAAAKVRLTEKQYRAQLRRAYLQLASFRLEDGTHASHGAEQSAPAWEQNYELVRSEEHTSELQSLTNLVCRLLLEKKNKQ